MYHYFGFFFLLYWNDFKDLHGEYTGPRLVAGHPLVASPSVRSAVCPSVTYCDSSISTESL